MQHLINLVIKKKQWITLIELKLGLVSIEACEMSELDQTKVAPAHLNHVLTPSINNM